MTRSKIGRYEIRRELGRGGMATVYLAYDPHFKREVAVKVLPPQFTHDPTFRQRFDNEAQTIAQIEHYAIVPVYDHGEDEGWPFIVMRLMSGGSLADKLQTGPLSIAETNDILQRLALSLDKAHQRGVVHRDVKPDNILFDEDGLAYLSDFGIAQLTDVKHTVTVLGTPEYMTPEQVFGAPLTAQTDVYQLGVLLFEMLTGQAPFAAASPIALLHKHVYEPVPSVCQLNRALPSRCEMIVARALAKKQEDRYSTAVALAHDFARLVNHSGHQLPQPRPVELTVQPVQTPPLREIPHVSKGTKVKNRRIGYWVSRIMIILAVIALLIIVVLYSPLLNH